MKASIKRPYQRQLLVVLSLAILTGCSGIQTNATSAYKSWEKRAYTAYKHRVAGPMHKKGVLPALFKTVSVPGMSTFYKPKVYRAGYKKPVPPKVEKNKPKTNTNVKELQYIEQHYGI